LFTTSKVELIHPSQRLTMSFTDPDPNIPARRKRVATERATENGDPLVANKNAREATKKAPHRQISFYTN
jgi:hypothetical protein